MNVKLVTGILIFIFLIVGGFYSYNAFFNQQEGYYPVGQTCAADNDCACINAPNVFDDCGKPDQVWKCINNQCELTAEFLTEDANTDLTPPNIQTESEEVEMKNNQTVEEKTAPEKVAIENNVLEQTRKLLISQGELPASSTMDDVKNYILPPLKSRPFVYYCGDSFILQYIGGEYHKLEYFSATSFNKINECENTWGVGKGPSPSCSVGNNCIPVRDFIYPLTLTTDKSIYAYGEKITVTLASNKNRNEVVLIDDVTVPYCAGVYFERIGSNSNDWIIDSVEYPKTIPRDCDAVTVSPTRPYIRTFYIDNTGKIPSGKWRAVHESGYAYLTAKFWIAPLNQEH